MTLRKSILLFVGLGMIAALMACSSSSSSSSSHPITVTLSTVPASLQVSATQAITATVANDSANGGVTWSCAPAGTCGTFSSATTASGVAVTYTAPATVPASTVVITATSVTKSTVSASTAAITITPVPVITVTLSATPTSMFVNDTASVTATVANDSANGGVTWSCAPAGTCGAFSSATSASGTAVTYTAPATVPASTVVLTATSVTNTAISASSPPITIDPASGITVSLSTPPPSSMATSATATIAATTTDTAGVNWSCAPAAACGSFNPTSTLSTVTTTYTAPTTAGSVTVTATSVTDNAISARAAVTITGTVSAPLADGNYVFNLSGLDTDDFSLYFVAGAFTVSGGVITGGEQDYVDFVNVGTQDAIIAAGSSITTTGYGTVQIVLSTNDALVGVSGLETLNATLLPSTPNKGFITELDGSGSATGNLSLQDTTAAAATPSLGYAFEASGFDNSGNILNMGGIINVDGAGTISGTGSIFDANDNSSGTAFQGETLQASTGTVTAPDSFGRVTFSITPTDTTNFAQIGWVGYIVDSSQIMLVETNDLYLGTTGGVANSQGANTGTFGNSSISGSTYGAVMSGFDGAGALQTVADLTFNSGGTVTGFIDFNDLSSVEPASPDPVSAPSYTIDATGRVTVTGLTDGAGTTLNLQLYLDGTGNAVAVTMDTTDNQGASLGGQLNAATMSNFTGSYALVAWGWDGSETGVFGAVGPVTATGAGGTFSGVADLNYFSTTTTTVPSPDLTVSGTYSASATTGILSPSSITGLDVDSGFTSADVFNLYLVGTNGDAVAIETDINQLTLGFFEH